MAPLEVVFQEKESYCHSTSQYPKNAFLMPSVQYSRVGCSWLQISSLPAHPTSSVDLPLLRDDYDHSAEIGTTQLYLSTVVVEVSCPELQLSNYPFSEHVQESSRLERQRDLKQRRGFHSGEK